VLLAWCALAILLILLGYTLFKGYLRNKYTLRKRGYLVQHVGHHVHYHELVDGTVRTLDLSGEITVRGPYLLYPPNSNEWDHTVPAWARGRRNEILERVRTFFGREHFELSDDRPRP